MKYEIGDKVTLAMATIYGYVNVTFTVVHALSLYHYVLIGQGQMIVAQVRADSKRLYVSEPIDLMAYMNVLNDSCSKPCNIIPL